MTFTLHGLRFCPIGDRLEGARVTLGAERNPRETPARSVDFIRGGAQVSASALARRREGARKPFLEQNPLRDKRL